MIGMIAFTLSGCNEDTKKDEEVGTGNEDNQTEERAFTESEGAIRYLLIEDEKVAIPETVGEYAKYLEKIGTKVELIANPNKPDDVIKLSDTLEANNQSSLKAYFKVYMDDGEYHKFGLHYTNETDKKMKISDAKIDKIILYNDQMEDELYDELMLIQTITVVGDAGEVVLDNASKSSDVMEVFGGPAQNTDGYLTYNDASGFVYKFATSNRKAILTQIEIIYPK